MAPVAERLSAQRGVLEPIQTALTLDGQVEELAGVLERHARTPVTLIGYSWGAWLALIVAARHPALVSKLILVGSGPFEEAYAAGIMPERLRRLDPAAREEVAAIATRLQDASSDDDGALARLGELLATADTFDPLPSDGPPIEVRQDIYQSVWPQAAELRASGELLELASRVRCPVVALHGDYDPHPAEGVREPLSRVVRDFRLVLLKDCGHTPWHERRAREEFYRVLESELAAR